MAENKPIIIDGIDVSKCKFFKIKDCDEIKTPYICGIEYPKDAFIINAPDLCCELNPNCIFKQLARKTQKCEKLKAENFTFEQLIKEYEKYGAIEEVIQQLNQLKAAKEQAEQKLERIKEYCKEQNLKTDYTACEILRIIDEVKNV